MAGEEFRVILRGEDGPFQRVDEFAHVAGPEIFPQGGLQVCGQAFHGHAVFAADAPGIVFRQFREVFRAFPQGGDVHDHGAHAEKQVAAEGTARDHFFQIAVGGADEAEIGSDFRAAAHGPETVLLQDAEKNLLHGQRQFAYLVQKKRSPVRLCHKAVPVLVRSGEGPLAVTEQGGPREGTRE